MTKTFTRSRLVAIALRVLIVLVLVKFFVVDSVAVRTRSMDPTLPARPETPESVVIDRTAAWRTPGRFDVIVFRYPNHTGISYVKRVIGLGGEQVALRRGFAWLLPPSETADLEAAWRAGTATLIRKPRALCDAFLDRFPVVDAKDLRGFTATDFDRLCRVAPEARSKIQFHDDLTMTLAGTEGVHVEWRTSPVDSLPDHAARLEHREASIPATGGENFVFGIAVGAEVSISPEAHVHFSIRLPDSYQSVQASVPAKGLVKLEVDGVVVGSLPTPIVSGVPTPIRLDTCDGVVTLRIGRTDVLSAPLAIVPRLSPPGFGAVATFGTSGGPCTFGKPVFARDLYWRDEGLSRFEVPAGHVMVLGDHPAASADSRHWKRLFVKDLRDGSIYEGDARTRRVGSDFEGPNPLSNDDGTLSFTDIRGEIRTAPFGTFDIVGSEVTPYVPLAAIRGRAWAIAWPWSHAGWIN